jgi:hypothetical protein
MRANQEGWMRNFFSDLKLHQEGVTRSATQDQHMRFLVS